MIEIGSLVVGALLIGAVALMWFGFCWLPEPVRVVVIACTMIFFGWEIIKFIADHVVVITSGL
ncbi:hypothetical protein CL634_09160 [bacterium]|nr:hypothetical protein [bacterium]|tara:strand:+ start:923 stop:1111 length:189 start_codon:yes stop_codon:yes gene_type:complete